MEREARSVGGPDASPFDRTWVKGRVSSKEGVAKGQGIGHGPDGLGVPHPSPQEGPRRRPWWVRMACP